VLPTFSSWRKHAKTFLYLKHCMYICVYISVSSFQLRRFCVLVLDVKNRAQITNGTLVKFQNIFNNRQYIHQPRICYFKVCTLKHTLVTYMHGQLEQQQGKEWINQATSKADFITPAPGQKFFQQNVEAKLSTASDGAAVKNFGNDIYISYL
jgi:hypothetical protein